MTKMTKNKIRKMIKTMTTRKITRNDDNKKIEKPKSK